MRSFDRASRYRLPPIRLVVALAAAVAIGTASVGC